MCYGEEDEEPHQRKESIEDIKQKFTAIMANFNKHKEGLLD